MMMMMISLADGDLKFISPKIHSELSRTHGTVDKEFGWKVLLREIIYRLQVQSQLKVKITRNTSYNLILVPGHGKQN